MKCNFLAIITSFVFSLTLAFQIAQAQSIKKVPPQEASLIAHLVKEANQPDYHSNGDVYLLVIIGKIEYIAELETGKVVSRRKAKFPGAGMCGDYAEIGKRLLNKNKQETAQGAGQVLRLSAGKWKLIALAESDYACADLREISQSVMKCLKVKCL